MSYLERIVECNRYNDDDYGYFYDHKKRLLARPEKSFIDRLLSDYGDVFVGSQPYHIALHHRLDSFDKRTKAIQHTLQDIQKKHQLFPKWRNENFRASVDFYEDAEFHLERGAVAHFGLKAWGVFINGYVKKPEGLYIWVAKRSKNKPSWPSKLDQIVGGGQPADLSPFENIIKEAKEEANIPYELAIQAQAVSAITYNVNWDGLHRDEMFIYDLELPEDFTPIPNDGEVESFTLMHYRDVADIVQNTKDFKANSAMVIIDFFIRHNIITPEHHEYINIIKALRK
ncbi:MAG: DUF4743 domain-containing protein [Alphaproteobacteria bacterium]